MGTDPNAGILVGAWTYRSFLINPDLSVDFDKLEFGRHNIRIDPADERIRGPHLRCRVGTRPQRLDHLRQFFYSAVLRQRRGRW